MSAKSSVKSANDGFFLPLGSGSGSGSLSSSGGDQPPLPPPTSCTGECQCPPHDDNDFPPSSPCGNDSLGNCKCPVDLATGAAEVQKRLLPGLAGSFDLSYSNLWKRDGVLADMHQGVGRNWATNSLAYTAMNEDGNLGFVWAPGRKGKSRWFEPAGGGAYQPLYGSHATVEIISDQWVLVDCDGSVAKFDVDSGKLVEEVAPGGDQTEYIYDGDQLDQIRHTVGTDRETRAFAYTGDLVSSVTLYKGTTTTPLETPVRRILLGYYTATAAGKGREGDLKTVTEQAYINSAWEDLGTEYFRYYTADSGTGFAGGLKFVVGREEYANLVTPDSIDDSGLAPVASVYYEYDQTTRRVTASHTHGDTQDYTITSYEESILDKSDSNNWFLKTVLSAPDGSTKTVYANSVGQDILIDLASGGDHWIAYNQYNSDWRITKQHDPSAVSAYSVNGSDVMSVTVNSSAGLIRETTYYTSTGSGGVEGYREYRQVCQGSSGTPVKLSKTTYEERTAGGATIFMPKTKTDYRSDAGGGSDPVETIFDYTWHSGTTQPASITTNLPDVGGGENGGAWLENNIRVREFDVHGRLTKSIDARGTETTYDYDDATGAIIQMTADAGGGGEQLVTDYEVDHLGRTVKELGPVHDLDGDDVRTVRWRVYLDDVHEVRTAQGYYDVSGNEYTLVNPISVTQMDESGRVTDQIEAVTGGTVEVADTELADVGSLAQTTWSRWTHHNYDDTGRLTFTRVYHDIPSSTAGSVGTNYDQTTFAYDSSGRRHKVTSPGLTITKQTYDPRGLVLDTYVGSDDSDTSSDNMVPVSINEYDGGADGGDGNVTKVTRPVSSTMGDDRVTRLEYDWRNRQTATVQVESSSREFRTELVLDNLGRAFETHQERVDLAGPTTTRIGKSKTFYDVRGRVFKTERFAVDGSGDPGNSLVDNTWFDEEGNVLKSLPAGSKLFTKNVYDALGRNTIFYQAYYSGSGGETVEGVTNDVIVEQSHQEYNEASQVTRTIARQRWHDTSGNGALQGPSGSAPNSRDSYAAMWYDGIGRSVASADYGTNNNAGQPSRPASVPSSSPTVLVSEMVYNARGEMEDQIDPAEKITRSEYDDAGRLTKQIRNYDSSPTEEIRQTYAPDGQLKKLTAVNADTNDQETIYTYGVDLTNSEIATSRLLRKVEYPDGGEVFYEYNRQGERIQMTDQNETIHSYTFDLLGRLTVDAVALPSGSEVDDAVLRIERTFDDRMRLEKVTSYDAATSGNVVNEVQYAYNFFNQVTAEYQARGGAVNTMTTSKVQYGYASGSANTIRPTSCTYPNEKVLEYIYDTGAPDKLSRASQLEFDSAPVAQYDYLGLSTPVKVLYPEPAVRYDLVMGGDINPYNGLDRFGRIVHLPWLRELGGSSGSVGSGSGSFSDDLLVYLHYGYDQASNRLYRRDDVARLNNAEFDELYGYDNLHRLTSFGRGELNGSNTALNSTILGQTWSLDPTGNWKEFIQTITGAFETTRAHNEANEIESITTDSGSPTWNTPPVYDANGNMTVFPQPLALADSFDATYDAWNRLVRIEDGGTVAEYAYDGLHRRTLRDETGGGGDLRHFYYSNQWQVLEERIEGSSEQETACQYVWGQRYVDDLVLRDEGGGKFYYLNDANFNVVAVVNDEADVLERYAYTPYGEVKYLQEDFTAAGSASAIGNNYLYTGRERDPKTGLQINRYRYYHAGLGQWLTRDPIDYLGGNNFYCYVNNMPTHHTDPAGLVASPDGCWTWVGTSAGGQAIFGYYRTKVSFYGNKSLLIGYRVYTCPNQVYKQPIYKVPKATGVIRTFPIGLGLGGTVYRWAAGRVCEAPDSSDIKGGDWSYLTCGVTALVAGFNFGGGSGNTEAEAGLDFGAGVSLSTTPSYTSIWTEGYTIFYGHIAPGFKKTLKGCKITIEGVNPPEVVETPPGAITFPE